MQMVRYLQVTLAASVRAGAWDLSLPTPFQWYNNSDYNTKGTHVTVSIRRVSTPDLLQPCTQASEPDHAHCTITHGHARAPIKPFVSFARALGDH